VGDDHCCEDDRREHDGEEPVEERAELKAVHGQPDGADAEVEDVKDPAG
jgi:hypothetical protein